MSGIFAAIAVVAGLLLLWQVYDRRYRGQASPAARPTDEVFKDPGTGETVRVFEDPASGAREYRTEITPRA